MEYSKFKYMLYHLSNLFSSKGFLLAFAVLFFVLVAAVFWYDYRTNGPIFSGTLKQGQHGRKNNIRKEIWLAIIPLLLLVLFVGGKKGLAKVDPPSELIPSKQIKLATTGHVASIDGENGKVAIVTNDRHEDNPIIAKVNNRPVSPHDPLIVSYGGTHLTNKELLALNTGDQVKIMVHPFTWKYKNHAQFNGSKDAQKQLDLLNEGKVNGEVKKDKSKPKLKPTPKPTTGLTAGSPATTTTGTGMTSSNYGYDGTAGSTY
ncbi:hypothetical protein M3M39_00700 [Fructilactobacillus hinvesii]|uniref:Uncharacterized protein n=1 Tax=Fructilactobacillus hinvesii TaxID=2940300 RepID=A0ABY5BWC7_9LACO|nr:hypothetical protein [Fructilactobacillus hinvesii]USS88039.1 hypothetical protein M3M39_00700 [Fructilactobacillus hinvesii]